MKYLKNSGSLALVFGGIGFILFAISPYLLDLIAPSKSIGSIIGENAKDLMDSLSGKKYQGTNTTRNNWSTILTIIAFLSIVCSLVFMFTSIQNGQNTWQGIGGGALSLLGLLMFFFQLALSFMALIILAVIVVLLVLLLG